MQESHSICTPGSEIAALAVSGDVECACWTRTYDILGWIGSFAVRDSHAGHCLDSSNFVVLAVLAELRL